MKLEDQVCSLELAKRLKELGVKQNSLFYWRDSLYNQGVFIPEKILYNPNTFHENAVTIYEYYSAFTVSELMMMLPVMTDITKRSNDYHCRYFYENSTKIDHSFDIKSADCLAKMLIHLLENKLMELPS